MRARVPRPGDYGLLLVAGVMVVLVRLALWVLPFRVVHRLLGTVIGRGRESSLPDFARVRRAGRAIERVGGLIPGATCLPQAIAGACLLRTLRQPSRLRIGVAKTAGFRAHAWVECAGRPVVGYLPDLSAYTVLTTVPRDAP